MLRYIYFKFLCGVCVIQQEGQRYKLIKTHVPTQVKKLSQVSCRLLFNKLLLPSEV
jgi:hypothetical protein